MRGGQILLPGEAPNWASALTGNITDWVQNKLRGPQTLTGFVKAVLPSAAKNYRAMIFVDDDIGGPTPAYSDGTNWRRVADGNIIS